MGRACGTNRGDVKLALFTVGNLLKEETIYSSKRNGRDNIKLDFKNMCFGM